MSELLVIYNPKSGTAHLLKDAKRVFAKHNPTATYMAITDKKAVQAIRAMRDKRGATVVAVGGDGTVGSVARELYGSACTLGIVPAGTLNHFAKALHLPTDTAKAAHVITQGKHKQVDVGTVNSRVFLNNSSIGFYPQSLHVRRRYGKHIGKWPAAVFGLLHAAIRPHHYKVQLVIDGTQHTIRTPFVFIGNNAYKRTPADLGERASLNSGKLSVYVIKATDALGVLRMLGHAVFTKKRRTQDFAVYTTDACTIRTRKPRRMRVACDGEVLHLRTPLHYKSQPSSLRVIVPVGDNKKTA